jgi:tRNA-specific 2-thiouridylase
MENLNDLVGKKVLVSMTGRVDSAVAAFLLKKQGLEVIGVTFVLNDNDANLSKDLLPRCYVSDLDQVKKYCDQLKIAFYAIDGKSQFVNDVIDPFVANKLQGMANNTCFNCNKLRFEILYEKMKKLKADYIASGHFAKIYKNLNSDEYFVHSCADINSDQSYLLAGVNKEILKHLLLPLGELKKSEVEKIAKNFNFQVGDSVKKSEFCFTKKEENQHLTNKLIPESMKKKGPVININNGFFYGEHNGIFQHYMTQRNLSFQGVTASVDKETIVVGFKRENQALELGNPKNLTFKGAFLTRVYFSPSLDRKKPLTVFVKTQYINQPVKAEMYFKNNSSVHLEFDEGVYPLILGEYMTLFDKAGGNAKIIGIGTVTTRGHFHPIDRTKEYKASDDKNNNNADLYHF